jgi:sarcosine oxidase subunit gamma
MANHHAAVKKAHSVDVSFIKRIPDPSRFIFRGDFAARAEASKVLGVTLSDQALTACVSGSLASLWLGPDETLLLDHNGSDLKAKLTQGMSSVHSMVDVSHRQVGIEITHPKVEWLLQAGCPLDLDANSFPVGRCTRTQFEKSEIILWRTAAQTFHLEIWRSFAPYVESLLGLTAAEL